MKWIKKVGLLCSMLCWLFSGCSTPYQSKGFLGRGYSDFQVTKDTFVINFQGNGFTPKETALKYVLRRAAEITLQHGYSHFCVLSNEDTTQHIGFSDCGSQTYGNAYIYSNSIAYQGNMHTQGSGYTINKPGNQITIRCFPRNSNNKGFDATQYLQFNPA